jgi:hypothetical protein
MVSLPNWLIFAALTAPADIEVVKFTSSTCAPCQAMEPVLEQVAARGYPIHRVDVDQFRQLADQYQITSVPTLLVVSRGQVVDRIEGALPLESLLPRLESVRAKTSLPATSQAGLAAPTARPVASGTVSGGAEQLALQATVRLRIEDANGHSFGTGTIIDVHGQDALVLTCGHIFRESQGKGKITVELFAPGARGPLAGELIRYDLQRDLALVGIRTAAPLRSVPVASSAWRPVPGQPLFSVGCNHGEDPTVMRGRLKAVNKYLGPENFTVEGRPIEGRSGGGLFSSDGFLVGVCNAADPELNEGLYAAFASVHRHLDDATLSFVYQPRQDGVQLASAAVPATAAEPAASVAPTNPLSAVAASGASDDLRSSIDNHGISQSAGQFGPVDDTALDSGAAEVICIVRTRNDPSSPSQVVVLDRPSSDFLSRLHEERRAQINRQTTQMRTPRDRSGSPSALDPTAPLRPARPNSIAASSWPESTSVPARAAVPMGTQRTPTARFTSDRRLSRPMR